MSDYSSYDEAIQSILDAQTDVDSKYKSIGNASSTLCDVNQTMQQIPDGSVVRNRGGEVIGYDYKYTTPKLPDIGIITVDSNTDSGSFGEHTGGGGHSSGGGAGRYRGSYYAGEVVDDPQSTDKMQGSGFVSGVVGAGWAAASVLAKFGKTVASVTADALERVDAHFGVNFGPLAVDFGYGTADMANAVRALFGVDNQGNTTMYLDEDVIGAMAIQTRDDGFYNRGLPEVPSYNPQSPEWELVYPDAYSFPMYFDKNRNYIAYDTGTGAPAFYKYLRDRQGDVYSVVLTYVENNIQKNITPIFVSKFPFGISDSLTGTITNSSRMAINDEYYYYAGGDTRYESSLYIWDGTTSHLNGTRYRYGDIIKIVFNGGIIEPVTFPPTTDTFIYNSNVSLQTAYTDCISHIPTAYSFSDNGAALNNFLTTYGTYPGYTQITLISAAYQGMNALIVSAYTGMTVGNEYRTGAYATPNVTLKYYGTRTASGGEMVFSSPSITNNWDATYQIGSYETPSEHWITSNINATERPTIPGVTDQDGATIPVDAITGADPHVVAQNLESQYPQVMGTPVQIVVMDDSCNPVTKKYYSVPISYSPTNLNIGAPITGGLQVSPSFNPDITLDLPDIDMDNYIDQIIKILGGSGAGRDVTVEPVPEDEPDAPSSDIPGSGVNYEPPATGSGDTPQPVTPNMTPTDLWHVYACSPTNLSLFGQWLWGPAFDIDLFKRIFSNPMDAVIGVHALFAIPQTDSPAPIVCGNIASSVSAPVVTRQYTEVNCGSVWLTEYFGNVFDYEPFTEVSLFLPFIGVVDLSVSDVMRGRIAVKYTVDVFTGACIAQVGVERDGSGGVLYQFTGSVAVGLPISGISYNTLFSSVLGMATSLAGAAASPTAAPAAVMSGVNSLLSYKDNVKRSGSFSGNAGAMGIKRPYLIISRPQPNTAENFEHYQGVPSNNTVTVNSLSGFQRFESIHLRCPSAYGEELKEIESLLKSGVLI